MRKLIFGTILVSLITLPAMALPTLDQVLPGTGAPALAPVGVSAVQLADLTDQTTQTSLLVEADWVGSENINTFGIYNYTGVGNTPLASEMLEVFSGPDGAPMAKEVQFDLTTGTAWITGDPGTTANIGATFGFYLGSYTGQILYTDELINPVCAEAPNNELGLIYNTKPTGWTYGGLIMPDVIVAFEHNPAATTTGGNLNWTDLIVAVEDVNVIPAPGAILLGSIGVSLVGWLRRRRSL